MMAAGTKRNGWLRRWSAVRTGRDVEAFCRAEHPRLLSALTLYTGDRDLAAELTQEALARTHRNWPSVSQMEAPGAWAHRVAVNLANSSLRRRRYERAAAARAAARLPAGQLDRPPSDQGAVELRAALAGLPRRQREALLLRFLLDLSVEDTAERMGCAPGTVRALTAQGVGRLRLDHRLAELAEPSHD
jgi:RNA polymerase sigma factor (sigma-70 family)